MAMHDSMTHLPMSWAEYNQVGDDIYGEYVDGALVTAPAPDRHHQTVAIYLVGQLNQVCVEGEGAVAGWGWSPPGVSEEYIPDVLVHPATDDQVRFLGTPLLCVEITSRNRSDDLILKRAKYAAAKLPDYWVVDRREHAFIQYKLRDGLLQEVTRATARGQLTADLAGRDVVLDLDLVLPPR